MNTTRRRDESCSGLGDPGALARVQHSPLPWHAREEMYHGTLLVDVHHSGDCSHVSESEVCSFPGTRASADATFIVTAVNSHDDLLAALTTVLRGFELGIFVRDPSHDGSPDWAMRLAPYIAALAKGQKAIDKAEAE